MLVALYPPFLVGQSVDSLYAYAVAEYPSLKEIQLAVERADARGRSLKAWDAPKAGVEFRMLPPSNPNPFARGETMIMVEQAIPLFGQNTSQAEVAEQSKSVQLAKSETIKRRLRSKIEGTYWQLLHTDEMLNLNARHRRLASTLYEDTQALLQVNKASQSDLFDLALEIQRLKAAGESLVQKRNEAQSTLNLLLNRPIDDTVIVVTPLTEEKLPPIDSLIPLLELHPGLEVYSQRARVKEVEAKAAESQLDPTLIARGGIVWMPDGHPVRQGNLNERIGVDGAQQFGLAVGATFILPGLSWSRDRHEAKSEAARIEAQEILMGRAARLRELQIQLREEYGRAERASIMLELYREDQLPLLEKQIEGMRGDYTYGRRSFSTLIEQYRRLVAVREEVVNNGVDYAHALTRIWELTGHRL